MPNRNVNNCIANSLLADGLRLQMHLTLGVSQPKVVASRNTACFQVRLQVLRCITCFIYFVVIVLFSARVE